MQTFDGLGIKGSADLSARFVLRARRLLNQNGQIGFICTNTLVQGATLNVGLSQVVRSGITIRKALTSHPWPSSSASLEIVEFWASAGSVAAEAERLLDNQQVPRIGADLQLVGRVEGPKWRLEENFRIAFNGSKVDGLGFVMTEREARSLIAKDPRNAEALEPYVIGDDINQRVDHSASRWIINFKNWPLELAETYPDLIEIVRNKVKPQRDRNNRAQRRDRWWIYAEHAPGLYAAIADLDFVLAQAIVSNVIVPVRVPSRQVFAHKCVVFACGDYGSMAFLSSNINFAWVVRYTSTLGAGINYSPSDVFLTLPRPKITARLEEIGERLDSDRRELMLRRGWGLTTTYNQVHDPAIDDPAVVNLRDIHSDIDNAVLEAYGWSDMDAYIGYHPTPAGTRWTFSPAARFELLDRLLEENHRRHERAEVVCGESPS